MERRHVLGLLAGSVMLPRRATAQQPERTPRLGLLVPAAPSDPEYPSLIEALRGRLQELGWSDGRNLQIEVRWGGSEPEDIYKNALELIALRPDVIVTAGSSTTGPALRATRTVPVIFTIVPDPVGAGFVETLARPGGNATGFTSFDYGIGGKWLELLREAVPAVKRVGVLRDADITAGIGQWSVIQAVAPMLGFEPQPINLHDADDLERALAAFAQTPNGGLIVSSGAGAVRHRDLIFRLATQHKLPTICYAKSFAVGGGLVSYGSNRRDLFRRAADYTDRVLKGEKPAALPVQAPARYELVVNLRTAKAIGLAVPPSLLARADEVIE